MVELVFVRNLFFIPLLYLRLSSHRGPHILPFEIFQACLTMLHVVVGLHFMVKFGIVIIIIIFTLSTLIEDFLKV
jgi:hypothetical protein